MAPTTKKQLIANLIKIWFHDEEIQNIVRNTINSMPNRVKTLHNEKGSFTKW